VKKLEADVKLAAAQKGHVFGGRGVEGRANIR